MSIALTSASRVCAPPIPRGISRSIDRSIDRDFETPPLKARDSSVARSLLRLEFLRDRRPCTAAPRRGRCNRWVPFFLSLPSAVLRFFLLFFYIYPISLSPSLATSFLVSSLPPLEQLTTGQPWPTDCTDRVSTRETYRSSPPRRFSSSFPRAPTMDGSAIDLPRQIINVF